MTTSQQMFPQRATLELLKVYSQMTLTNVAMTVDARAECFHSLVLQLQACVASENQEPIHCERPATWWDHFKRDVVPQCIRRWFKPARMTRDTFDVKTVYPFLKTRLPAEVWGERVSVLMNGLPIGSFLSETPGLSTEEWNAHAKAEHFDARRNTSGVCPCCARGLWSTGMGWGPSKTF